MNTLSSRETEAIERYASLGPGCRAAAIKTANGWLEEEQDGTLRFLEDAREVALRIVAMAEK